MKGTWAVFRAELYRLSRVRSTLVIALLLAGVSALRVAAARLAEVSLHSRRVAQALSEGREVPQAEAGNAFGPFVDGWLAGLVAGALLLLIYSSRSLASDRERGILRLSVTRGATRGAQVLGRALMAPLLTLAVMVVTGAGALAAAAFAFDFTALVEDGYEIATLGELWSAVAVGALAAFPPLVALWTFGLLVSSAARGAAGAVASALVAFLLFDLFKEALGPDQYFVFATYCPSLVDTSCLKEAAGVARGFSDAGYPEARLLTNLWLPWPQALLATLAAWALTRKRRL